MFWSEEKKDSIQSAPSQLIHKKPLQDRALLDWKMRSDWDQEEGRGGDILSLGLMSSTHCDWTESS